MMTPETRKRLQYAAHDAMWAPPRSYIGAWDTGQHEPPETPQRPTYATMSHIPAWTRYAAKAEAPLIIFEPAERDHPKYVHFNAIPAWMRRAAERSEP